MHARVLIALTLCLAFSLAALRPIAADDQPAYSADHYALCSACHLPDGNGVPGIFPPVRDRAARIAALDGGREYLVTVVSYGLMGMIDVAGTPYAGVMAGNAGMLTPEEIAAALNYTVFELTDANTAGVAPFTGEEVVNVQTATSNKGPSAAGELRQSVAASAGDQWP